MKNALIIYNSKTGTTENFAREINSFLNQNNISSKVVSIIHFKENDLLNADYVLLGCWTSGLFFVLQKPEKIWIEFAKSLPSLKNKKIGLFTTYKIAVGSMFRNMSKHLNEKIDNISIELKSRNGKLDSKNINAIKSFII